MYLNRSRESGFFFVKYSNQRMMQVLGFYFWFFFFFGFYYQNEAGNLAQNR